jgi:hypothetical protein
VADLEVRLRDEVLRRVHGLEPSPDLPDRIHVQVRRHRRRRQAVAAGLSIGVAAALVLVVALVSPGRLEDSTVRTGNDNDETVTSDVVPDRPPSVPAIAPDTPLSRSGVGPIMAGMTLRQAAEAARVVITPFPSNPENACTIAYVEGDDFNLRFLAERTGAAGEDPMQSVIRGVSIAGEGSTEEEVAIGDPVANLTATYGPPTRTYDESDGPGSQTLVFESGEFAYAVLVGNGKIAALESGDPTWVGLSDPGGCE